MCSCNREEVDTRIPVHIKNALDKGGRGEGEGKKCLSSHSCYCYSNCAVPHVVFNSAWIELLGRLGWERISRGFPLTPFVSIWASRNAVRLHFFTRSLVLTLRQHSWRKERNLRGRPRKRTLKPQKLSFS